MRDAGRETIPDSPASRIPHPASRIDIWPRRDSERTMAARGRPQRVPFGSCCPGVVECDGLSRAKPADGSMTPAAASRGTNFAAGAARPSWCRSREATKPPWCGVPRAGRRARKAPSQCARCGADFTIHEQDLHTVCPNCLAGQRPRAVLPPLRRAADRGCPGGGRHHAVLPRLRSRLATDQPPGPRHARCTSWNARNAAVSGSGWRPWIDCWIARPASRNRRGRPRARRRHRAQSLSALRGLRPTDGPPQLWPHQRRDRRSVRLARDLVRRSGTGPRAAVDSQRQPGGRPRRLGSSEPVAGHRPQTPGPPPRRNRNVGRPVPCRWAPGRTTTISRWAKSPRWRSR